MTSVSNATQENAVAIKALLSKCQLPIDDFEDLDLSLFLVVTSNDALQAVGGLERLDDLALLRSVATAPESRGSGQARELVVALEALASSSGIRQLFLLTETAQHYFQKLGYEIIDRNDAPLAIRSSRQFSSLCPASAIVMTKTLRTAEAAPR